MRESIASAEGAITIQPSIVMLGEGEHARQFEELVDEGTVQNAFDRLGKSLVEHLGEELEEGEQPVGLCVMKGGMFATMGIARVMREEGMPIKYDTVELKSYGNDVTSSGIVHLKKDYEVDVKGRPVVIFDDLLDSCLTVNHLIQRTQHRGARSITVITLLDKPDAHRVTLPKDVTVFTGMSVSADEFVVGCGMDYREEGRELPAIYTARRDYLEKPDA
jgi:hypoxanthine phosphoribosyltransferase